METNILKALGNITKLKKFKLKEIYSGQNRINNIGVALEYFIRDLFCDSVDIAGLNNKEKEHFKYLSYSGNQNNPPDFVIKNGDAIEVKKIENFGSVLALNSSYPKNVLSIGDTKINNGCRSCDGGKWKEKELFYIIGNVAGGNVKYLYFVQGKCYAANHDVYDKIHLPIKNNISSILDSLGLENGETSELGKVKRVDPLGITELRIRGMWQIENPISVFNYIIKVDKKERFFVNAIMLEEKYNSFPEKDRESIENNSCITLKSVKIKSPNNPAQLLDAKLITL